MSANYNMRSDMGQKMILKFIKERMEELGVSQAELARRTDLQKSTISRYLNKQMVMSLNNFVKICKCLDFEIELRKKDS